MKSNKKEELPKRMKEAMTRKEGYVFKVRAVEGRKNEGGEVGVENDGISARITWE